MEMKSVVKATAVSLLMASAMSAMAVPVTMELTVKGSITPSACKPVINDSGVIDYGEISAGRIPSAGTLLLEAKSVSATITCASAAKVAMTFADNRASTVPAHSDEPTASDTAFGLGEKDGIKIGSYGLKVTNMTGDAVAGEVLSSSDRSSWDKMSASAFVQNTSGTEYVTFGAKGTSEPTAATVFTFDLEVTPSLKPELHNITEAVTLDGNATINFIYL